MESVGLRELRQDASALVKRAEAGELIEITVAGRPAAVLSAAAPGRWRSWGQVAPALEPRADARWRADMDLLDHDLRDPWASR